MSDMKEKKHWLRVRDEIRLEAPIEYRQGETVVSLMASAVPTPHKTTDAQGVKTVSMAFDFLIPTGRLPFTPQVGDRIVCKGRSYEVFHCGDGVVSAR